MALDFTTSIIKLNNQYTIVGTANDVEPTTVPKKGELYFLPENSGERTCKIGDGKTQFQHLPVIGVSKLSLEDTSETKDVVNLAYNGKYKLNVGNKNIVFKMPPSIDPNEFTDTFQAADYTSGLKIATGNNTPDLYVPTGTSANTVALGNHTHNNYESATVGTEGWYRIYTGGNDSGKDNILVTLEHTYAENQTEAYSFMISVGYFGDIQITQLSGVSTGGTIKKLRVVTKNSAVAFIDFYKITNSVNTYYVGGIGAGTFCAPTSCTGDMAADEPTGYYTRTVTVGASFRVNGSLYAGGTAVTLNGSSKAGATASLYAPTTGGTSGYICVGAGTTSAPTWVQTLPIANGGTGATTADDARANLKTATLYTVNDISTTSPAFPSESTWGATFSSKSIVNTTEKNDNYMLHVSSLGNLYTGYQINKMTTPTWTKVSLDGHATHPSISWGNKVFKELNSKGWYRVYLGANSNTEGDTVLINISSEYQHARTITLSFVITLGYLNDANIKLLSRTGQDDSCISNIRVVKDPTVYGKSYIDIYFNKTNPEYIYVTGIGQGTFQAPEAAPPLTSSQDVIELDMSNYHTLGSNTGYVLTTTSGTVGISQGGTGATTADAARKNLGAAAKSHTHSASDLTSGTLGMARGGTGATNAADARANLGAAAKSHTHSASDLTSGTLSIARGGTGTTSQNMLSMKVFTGLYDSAIVSTNLTKGVSMSSLTATQYISLTTTIKAIVLGATGQPTDSAGVLTFNGVTIANGTNGNCIVTFRVKKRSSSASITDTTIVLPIISIPLS